MADAIEEIERRWSEQAMMAITLAGQAEKWSTFAQDVRDGYQLAIDNYTNSLSIRGMLEEALSVLADRDREWLFGLVGPADATYLAATRADPERLIFRFYRHDDEWWWNRVPIKLGSLAGEYGLFPRGDPRRST